jgi:uncharacterized protein (DUF305 family)
MVTRRIALAGLGLILTALVVGLLALGFTPLFGGPALARQAMQAAGGRGMMGGGGMMNPGQTPGPGMMPGGMMNPQRTPGAESTPGGMMDGDEDCGAMMGGLMNGTGYNDPSRPYDQRFLDAMIPHHEMAVQSAQHMIADSAHPELRDLAQRIIAGQQAEIAQMQQWRSAWYTDTTRSEAAPGMMGGMMSSGMMSSGMMNSSMMGGGMMGSNVDPDRMFLQMMIPHHEAAIRMAEDALQQATHPEIRTLAEQIMTTQRAEITEMRQYLRDWYGITNP